MSEDIPQREALRLQLALVGGNEPATSLFEIRSKKSTGGMRQVFIPVQELDRAVAACLNTGRITDTYLGVTPRTHQRGTADAVERSWTLWADCDEAAAVERLRSFRPLPSLVIRSGSDDSAHAYWALRSAIPPHFAQRANRRLALAMGADIKATDPARILRPAGTLNHKHSPPRPVICTRLELDVFTVDEVVRGLPDDREYVRSGPRPRKLDFDGSVLDGLVRTVRDAQPPSAGRAGSRNNVLFWAASRVREHAENGRLDGNAGREALRDAALAAGLPEPEVDRTLSSALDLRASA